MDSTGRRGRAGGVLEQGGSDVLPPGTSRTDRLPTRRIYAEFGVPSSWLVEQATGEVTVLTLRDGTCVQTARGTRLELEEPFPVVIDLSAGPGRAPSR